MKERQFWVFVWLCMKLAFAGGLPRHEAAGLALWSAQLLIRKRYFA